MTKAELSTTFLLIAQLISLLTGNKPRKNALAILPAVVEMTELWPAVRTSLDSLAASDESVARFRQLIDESLAVIKPQ